MEVYMKQRLLIFLVAFLVIPVVALAGIIGPARVVLIEGDVMFHTPDTEEWLPASINTPLDEGDALWIPTGSRSEIQLTNGTVIRVDGGSQLDLIAFDDGFTHLHLASGRLYLRTALKAEINSLQIDADDTTILPDARTRLRIDMLPNSQEDVSIFKGSAYVEGNGNRTKVRAGEHIALEEGHSELLSLNSPDDWERWNSERDRNQSRTSTTNLPDELQAYSRELDTQGRWVQTPEYGMVWRPTVILSDDWAPYRSGRWIWKGDDYVWISYENWGWAPYHYGRWAVVSGFGWCWVPPARGDIYWGPGYVGWYRNGTNVGWTPLAPGETFYGHRNYGRHSVNITNSTVNAASIEYRNRNARGGFSILLQNDFLKGRTVFQKPSNSAAFSVSVSLGSPRIQPLRETRMPIIKHTPPHVPPPAVQRHDNRELQVRFPRVTPVANKERRPQPVAIISAPASQISAPARPSTAPAPRFNDESKVRTVSPQPNFNQPGRRDPATSPVSPNRTVRTVSQHNDAPQGQVNRTKEIKQKKVWKVTTTEQDGVKDQKERDGKEHKNRK
jgi:hypothetical protein